MGGFPQNTQKPFASVLKHPSPDRSERLLRILRKRTRYRATCSFATSAGPPPFPSSRTKYVPAGREDTSR
jgi:hypothetical protein